MFPRIPILILIVVEGTVENDWTLQMYDMKSAWIPIYFKDNFLVGISRTTSIFERENSFFGNYLNKNLKSQRHKELLTNNDTLNTMLKRELQKDIKKYRREVSYEVRVNCRVEGTKEDNE
ncbi:hypothetical protein CR513_49704, partial [Mucuna pruriens]